MATNFFRALRQNNELILTLTLTRKCLGKNLTEEVKQIRRLEVLYIGLYSQ